MIEQHLRDTANQKLGFAPPIFPVSARKAFLARTTGVDKEGLWKKAASRRSKRISAGWSMNRSTACAS